MSSFDVKWSHDFFTFTNNNQTATLAKTAANHFPTLRLNSVPFTNFFSVELTLMTEPSGTIGVSSLGEQQQVLPLQWIGYTEKGWMINHIGELWHDNKKQQSHPIRILKKVVSFHCDYVNNEIKVLVDGKLAIYTVPNLSSFGFFVVYFPTIGGSVTIHSTSSPPSSSPLRELQVESTLVTIQGKDKVYRVDISHINQDFLSAIFKTATAVSFLEDRSCSAPYIAVPSKSARGGKTYHIPDIFFG